MSATWNTADSVVAIIVGVVIALAFVAIAWAFHYSATALQLCEASDGELVRGTCFTRDAVIFK